MTLETLEKETRDLQLEINEEERQIDLKKKELPLRKKSEEDITMLQIELEMSLSDQERRLLEKQLLVDQVTRLSQPLSKRAENCQQDRLSLAKKSSMKHATALSLQQEIKEKEFQMDRCQRQPEEGLPTCPELEKEWRRMLRDRKRRRRDKEERERLAEEEQWNQLPNGEYTTAESRPNATSPRPAPSLCPNPTEPWPPSSPPSQGPT
ncbi:hypothetical protein F7725_021982 [Dissostichus mawsoni]|uniref:Uncharacterized protein n=1 Tax=Dissostichus mawsoni TaxID=36200 RepID=A0A7J5ZDC6_DISMA|nr:hypothetical protein F7725_021982 [Dissostichus mawsoni]